MYQSSLQSPKYDSIFYPTFVKYVYVYKYIIYTECPGKGIHVHTE